MDDNMKIDDAITLADLTVSFMKVSNIGTDKPLDSGTFQLIDTMESLVSYAKKNRMREILNNKEIH
jgi:hypothetical protein